MNQNFNKLVGFCICIESPLLSSLVLYAKCFKCFPLPLRR